MSAFSSANTPRETMTTANSEERIKETGSVKIKRMIASKMSESKSGRAVIHRLAGNIGTHIMDALFSSMVKFSDIKTAQSVRVNIYKIATKSAVYIRENVITDEMMRSCKSSNMLLLYCLLEQFQAPIHLRSPEALHTLVQDCYTAVMNVLTPIPNSSPERLTLIKEFILERGFLDYLLTCPDIDLEREVILNNLNRMMQPYEDEAAGMALVLKDSLQQRRKDLAALVAKPQLVNFLRRQDTSPLLQEWLLALRGPDCLGILHFYSAMKDYMGVSNRALLPRRASNIYDRFVSRSGEMAVTSLPLEICERLRDRIYDQDCPPTLFAEALAFVVSDLQRDFDSHFPSSEQFALLQRELEQIDNKMIAFFHEDPSEFLIQDEAEVEGPSMFERISFWR